MEGKSIINSILLYKDMNVLANPKVAQFMYSVKSERSQELYQKLIRYFYEFSKISIDELLRLPIKDIEELLIKYVIYMRNRKLSHASVKNRISPIITFLELNDIVLNKKKIRRFFGEQKKTVKDLAYTMEDIQKMMSVATLRSKMMIAIFVSTGIRKSAIVDLKLKHLKKIPEYGLYKVTVYDNTKDEYYTFTTTECANMIDEYIEYRKNTGERITSESYLLRDYFDHHLIASVTNPIPITPKSLSAVFRRILLISGVRNKIHPQSQRHDKAEFHAFRKAYATTLVHANVNHLVKELLMGHSVGLDNSYYRPSEEKMLGEYTKAVDALTIDPSNRLKRKVKVLEERQNEIELMKLKHEKEMEAMDQKLNKIMSIVQQNPKLAHAKPEALFKKNRT